MKPIGSIVYLNEGSQKLMILNRGPIIDMDNQKYIFDYSACIYPMGLAEDQVFYFNEENIDRVVFEGYSDNDEIRFQELYNDMQKDLDTDIKKGKVTEEKKFGLE